MLVEGHKMYIHLKFCWKKSTPFQEDLYPLYTMSLYSILVFEET